MQRISLLLSTCAGAAEKPNKQQARGENTRLRPLTRTCVPPELGPCGGQTLSTEARANSRNIACVALKSAPLFETRTASKPGSTGPGVMHDSRVLLTKRAGTSANQRAGRDPEVPRCSNRHVVTNPDEKPAPCTSTGVPPESNPKAGATRSTRGKG